MTVEYFPVVIERQENGTYSAWVAGVPGVYAAADTAALAKRSIRGALTAHLAALNELGRAAQPKAEVVVLRRAPASGRRIVLRFAGLGALLGRKTSSAKAQSSRRNGRKGGRPVAHAG
jgi:predicted RNase H-like HicB family nuclease